MQLPDVLHCEPGVADFERARQVNLAQVPKRPVLEVQVLERPLQRGQVGGPGADGQRAQVVHLVLRALLLHLIARRGCLRRSSLL